MVRKNIANALTVLRLVLCFVFLWTAIVHRDWIWTMIFLVAAALITDSIDGPLARRFKAVSAFGEALDPFADKLLLGVVFFLLLMHHRIDLVVKIFIIPIAVIEALLLGIRAMGGWNGFRVPANKHGKRKMILESSAMLISMLYIAIEEYWGDAYRFFADIILILIFAGSLYFAVRSFVEHIIQYRHRVRDAYRLRLRTTRDSTYARE